MFEAYAGAVAALGYVAVLMLVQLVVADVVGIRQRHVPGSPVEANHNSVLFRVGRTVGNTNESIAIFICALLFCFYAAGSPTYTSYCAWGFAVFRTLYAVCYYANLQTLRSVSFALALLSLVGLVGVGWAG